MVPQILWSYPVPWSHREENGTPNPMVLSRPVVPWGGEWYPKSYGPIPSCGPMGRRVVPQILWSYPIPWSHGEENGTPNPMVLSRPVVPWGGDWYPKSYGPIPSRGPWGGEWYHKSYGPIPSRGGEWCPKSYGPIPSHGPMGRRVVPQILWSSPWSHGEENGTPNPMVLSRPMVPWGGEWYPKSYGPLRGPMGRRMVPQILWSYPVPWSHGEGNGTPNPMVLSCPVVPWGGEWYPKSYGPFPSRGPMGRGRDYRNPIGFLYLYSTFHCPLHLVEEQQPWMFMVQDSYIAIIY